jgi:hypothetical protein
MAFCSYCRTIDLGGNFVELYLYWIYSSLLSYRNTSHSGRQLKMTVNKYPLAGLKLVLVLDEP